MDFKKEAAPEKTQEARLKRRAEKQVQPEKRKSTPVFNAFLLWII